jgi:hypothetical protein
MFRSKPIGTSTDWPTMQNNPKDSTIARPMRGSCGRAVFKAVSNCPLIINPLITVQSNHSGPRDLQSFHVAHFSVCGLPDGAEDKGSVVHSGQDRIPTVCAILMVCALNQAYSYSSFSSIHTAPHGEFWQVIASQLLQGN